jgi:hypothetical protein
MQGDEVIERALRRTRGYWYEDGLSEIALGLIFAAIGLLFWAEGAGRVTAGLSSLGLLAIVIGGSLLGRWAVAAAKERLTYPRTGYVAYRRERSQHRRLATGLIAGGVSALVAFLTIGHPASLAWLPALQGLLGGGALLYGGAWLGLRRYWALALCSAAAGLACSLAGLGDLLGSGVFFLALGLAIAVSGLATLILYLRRTAPAAER